MPPFLIFVEPFLIMSVQAVAAAEYIRKGEYTMTDNEKRAHDLAIAMLPMIYDRDYRGKDISNGDAFEIYKDAYTQFLERLNYGN